MFFRNKRSKKLKIINLINSREGCIASNRITIDRKKVGYMYREEPYQNDNPDGGWRFLAGDEDEVYMNNNDNHNVYALNTICNFDRDIIEFLEARRGSAFIRNSDGQLVYDIGDNPLQIPNTIDGAKVIMYVTCDEVSDLGYVIDLATGFREYKAALVIAQYNDDDKYYIFGCNTNLEVISDSLEETLEDAISFNGLVEDSTKWIKVL